MIKDKMIMNDDEMNKILKENEDNYRLKVEQSLGKINMFRDGEHGINDNWLKPYCFDKWKIYLK
jgi:hypothetical protein